MTSSETPRHLPTLDGWRAVAITGVLIAHGASALIGPDGATPWAAAYAATRYGVLGVDLFFALSGFLISWRLADEYDQTGRIALGRFYLRRAFRILPAYFGCLIALLLLTRIVGLALSGREWAASLFFVRNYLPAQDGGWYTGHFWSLAVEEHFYLIWPVLVVAAGVGRARVAAMVLALGVAAWRVVEFRWQLVPALIGDVAFYERTDLRLDALVWGCVTALSLRAWGMSRVRETIPPFGVYAVAVLLAFNAVVQPPLALLWQALLFPLLFVTTLAHSGHVVGRLLDASAVRWLGRLSYSLYLWQQLFLVAGSAAVLPLGIWQMWPLNVAALFACAVSSYYLIERPALEVGRALSLRGSRRPLRVPAPATSGG